MNYIIFAIDTHIQEFLFIFEYTTGSNRLVLGELIKINNLCYTKGFDFDFFEIIEDPNYALNKEGIYIYKYNTFEDILHRLDIQLTAAQIQQIEELLSRYPNTGDRYSAANWKFVDKEND